MADYLKGAEPFAFEGNETGVLVIHGFTGSTQSMRYLGQSLHERFGFTVVGPCLPGHGTSPDEMSKTGYLDWLGAVERELKALAARKKRVFVTGLSMGGTLTLNLAARFPKLVQGIAPISAAAGPLPDGFWVCTPNSPLWSSTMTYGSESDNASPSNGRVRSDARKNVPFLGCCSSLITRCVALHQCAVPARFIAFAPGCAKKVLL